MKILRFLLYLLILVGIIYLGLMMSGNTHLVKGIWATYLHGYSSASIGDERFFETRVVKAEQAEPWAKAKDYNRIPLSDKLRDMLEETRTVAFLIAHNGDLIYEEYWDGYSDTSRSNSFSMAKSITTMLVQIAIQKGVIGSWEDPLIKYIPEIQGPYREELKLKHLSTMSSGIQWEENYSGPFSITAKSYYGDNVEELMLEQVPVVRKPGEEYYYQSGSTQLLGMVLYRATRGSVSEFASEYLWTPIGAVHDATWHIDKDEGMELTYCCFNSNARDFARFGQLLLNSGKWKGKEILDSSFIQMATQPQLTDYYGYSFWIDTDDHLTDVVFMRGILGQYIIAIPEYDLLIVRLGHERMGKKRDIHPEDFHIMVEEVLKYYRISD